MMIRSLLVYAGVLLFVAGCATPAPAPAPPLPAPTSDTSERSFDEAVNVATDGLVAQLQQRPGPSAKTEARRSLVIDPMVDVISGQQTAATLLLEQRVAERLRSSSAQIDVVPFQVVNLSQAQYLLTGTMARVASSQPGAPQAFEINMAVTDLKDGMVVAKASSRARDEGVDTNPAHVVLKTGNFDAVIAWYAAVLNARVAFRSDFIAFLTYDDEHHRVAVINAAGSPAPDEAAAGVHHIAYTYAGLGELLGTYRRLKASGHRARPLHQPRADDLDVLSRP